jgi:rhamnosyltransferase
MSPGISVVIRTFNSAATLPEVLRNLDAQPDDELIVVDSGSRDKTLEIADQHAARILTAEKPFNYSSALNAGFAAARNSWVMALSSHCIPVEPHYLAAWRRVLEKLPPSVVSAYGRLLTTEKSREVDPDEAVQFFDRAAWEQNKQINGGNANGVYRRDVWQQHEFDKSWPTAEDLEWLIWAIRHGHLVAYVPARKVFYRNLGSMRHMYGKGFKEANIAREFLDAGRISVRQLAIALASLAKKLLLGKIGPRIFLRQCAHACGAFRGSRMAHRIPDFPKLPDV